MKLLLVDDNEEVGGFIRASMQEAGHETTVVRDSESALQNIQSEHFDAIIIDLVLGKADGNELIGKIRAQKNGQKTPVLTLSPVGTSLARRMADAAGSDGFLVKPFGMGLLAETLRTLRRK